MQDVSSTADDEWRALSTVEGLTLLGGFGSFRLREVGDFRTTVRGPLSGRREFTRA